MGVEPVLSVRKADAGQKRKLVKDGGFFASRRFFILLIFG